MQLTFLGANRQVTGSRYCLEAGGLRLLIDCGMFQERAFQERNYASCPLPAQSLDVVLLTHAHLDHSGLLPRLVGEGFARPIYTTSASVELTGLVLHDAARLLAEDAAFKQTRHQREGKVAPHPYLPLYTPEDVERTLRLLHRVDYAQPLHLNDQLSVTWHDAGHILGSSLLEIAVRENGRTKRLVFSGDLGLWDKPIIKDPTLLQQADYIVMESTYGDKDHDQSVPIEDQLADVINDTVRRGGNLVVPTFAIERAQELLFYLGRLLRADRIPHLMVFLDSPMAVDATDIFTRHGECLDEQMIEMLRGHDAPFKFPGLVLARTPQQSKAINHLRGTGIIMAGAGMCTGGRIKHHLAQNISRPESTILFVGYQAEGTLGREIMSGRQDVRILGRYYPVKAHIATLQGMSAHADRATLLRWLGAFRAPPQRLFLTHGEATVALSLAEYIQQTLGWPVTVPEYKAQVVLT